MRDFNADEMQTIKETTANHQVEFELLATLVNFYIHGLSQADSLDEQNSDTHWVWLLLLTRSFHSLRCSISLMQKGYYAQTIALLRMITEAYFLCGNVDKDESIANAILRNKPDGQDGKTRFDYKKLATKMDALVIYDNIYSGECEFSHFTNLSASILAKEVDERSLELVTIPHYDKAMFMACCDLSLRNGVLMIEFMEKLLSDLSETKVNNWREQSINGIHEIEDWLRKLKAEYGY